jgi:hypothetical protein
MQSGVAATFTDSGSVGLLLLGPLWFLMFALLALAAFTRRTRNRSHHTELVSVDVTTAVVRLMSRPDGSIVVESRSGPVMVCSHLSCDNPCAPSAPVTTVAKTAAKRAPVRQGGSTRAKPATASTTTTG